VTELEEKYGWIAHIVAATIVTGFQVLRAYLKFVFDMLSKGSQGFFMLILLHVLLLYGLTTLI